MAAAAIPAILEAAPTIINAAMMARGIISKYAPTAKKVVGMLFKAHNKSPGHFLRKIRGLTSGDISRGVSGVSKFLQSGKVDEMINDANRLRGLGSTSLSSARDRYQNPSGQSMATSYHNILEQFK